MSIEMIPDNTDIFCLSCGAIALASPFTAIADLPKHPSVSSPQQIIPQSETVGEDNFSWKVKHQICVRCQHKAAADVEDAYRHYMSEVEQSTEEYRKAQAAKRKAEEEREQLETEKAWWGKQVEICPEILIRDSQIFYREPDIVRGLPPLISEHNDGSRKIIPSFVERSQFRCDQIQKQKKIEAEEKDRREALRLQTGTAI